jgi:ribosome-associated toxin RatA of RatAB toxin-antitoxin module
MRKVRRTSLVPYTNEQMFALVDAIDAYPEFLPWCSKAVVHSRTDTEVDATLEMSRGGLSKSFRTRNTAQPHDRIDLQLVDGPFRNLSGSWQFQSLGEKGCKVSLALDFTFENRLTDMMFGPFFEEICNRLVDAFTRRAAEIYGASQ